MGDDDSKTERDALNKKLQLRTQASKQLATVLPNMHLQLVFNQLAGTSVDQQLGYLEGARQFHEKLRLFFYPKVFEAQKARTIDWNEFSPEYYKEKLIISWFGTLPPTFMASILLVVVSIPRIRRL